MNLTRYSQLGHSQMVHIDGDFKGSQKLALASDKFSRPTLEAVALCA